MVTRMVFSGTSYFGEGARSELKTELQKRGFRKALLVTDKGLVDCGVASLVEAVLKEFEFPYEIFAEIKPNPTVENVLAGVSALKESKADVIVAVGGGSSIDTAKAIAVVINNPENQDVVSLEGVDKNENPPLPVIALPTTAGTGSETTMDYVITNLKEKRKMACMCSIGVPVASILDSELMAGLPLKMSVAVGMDALTHAVESFMAKGANEFSTALSLKAISLISENFIKLIENPKNLEVRKAMAMASFIAGMSFTNAGLGIVHSMAHPLSAFYDIPHGVANALILPYIIDFNSSSLSQEQVIQLGRAFSPDFCGNKYSTVSHICQMIQEIEAMADLPLKLNELNVKKEDLELLAESALSDCATLDNPKEVTKKDLLVLYKTMF